MREQDQSSKNKRKHKGKSKKGVGKKVFTGFLVIMLIVAAIGSGVVLAILKSAPDIDANLIADMKQSGKLYDKNGEYIEDLSDVENRQFVPLTQIPKHLQDAVISIEDERFETHHGVDIKRVFGALAYDIKTMSKAQGASTITQQLIKNTVLTPEKAWTRKIQEMYLAIKLERILSKDQILNAYLNTMFLGGNAYGVQAASFYYFGKDVSELSIAESALIAGLTQNPSKYWPYSKRNKENPENYVNRQKLVLSKMLELGKISNEEYTKALKEPLVFKTKEAEIATKFQWFVEPAIDQIAADYAIKFGITESEAKQQLRTGGYKIYLTIDSKIQQKAEEVVNDAKYYPKIPEKDRYYAINSKDKQLIQPQGAAVIMDALTGEVRAIVGGRGEHPLRSNNRATDTDVARQPGSAIKPLAVYAPAIDKKLITAASTFDDSPMPKDFVDANDGWDPKNYNGKFGGLTTIRDGIKDSVNLVAIKVLKSMGTGASIDYLKNKFHISTVETEGGVNDRNLSALSLGGMTHGVTPLEMTAAYAVFANGGVYSEPIMYTKVVDSKGTVILEKTSDQSKAISKESAYLMSSMLQTVVTRGTGTKAKLGNMPAGGKTGTSDEHTNGWFMGITPYYSGAAWIGHDKKNYKISSLVGGTAAPMWREIMKVAHEGLDVKSFPKPETGIVTKEVCIDSGKAPTELCSKDPRGSRIITEEFIEGTEPVEFCNVHVEVSIDSSTGKLATDYCPADLIQKKVFLNKAVNPRAATGDDAYLVPVDYCPIHTSPQSNENNGEDNTNTEENELDPKDDTNEPSTENTKP